MKQSFLNKCTYILLTTGMGVSLGIAIFYLLGLPIKYMFIIGVVGCVEVICNLLWCQYYSFFTSVGLGGIGIGVLFYLRGEEKWAYKVQPIFTYLKINQKELFILICIALVVYLLTAKFFKRMSLLLIGSVLYGWILFKEPHSIESGLILFIVMSLLYFFYDYYLQLSKEEEKSYKLNQSYMKITLYFCSITIGIALLSASLVPLQFTALHRLLDNKENNIGYGYSKYYPYTGVLGGDRVLGDEEILEVTTTRETYLKADTKSIYTGSAWTNVNEGSTLQDIANYEFVDTLEMLNGIELLGGWRQEQFYLNQLYRVTFRNVLTQSLFMPTKSINLALSQNTEELYQKHEDTLFLSSPYGSGFSYSVHGYTPQYNSKAFKDLMRKSEKGLYTQYKDLGGTHQVSWEMLEKLEDRAEQINEMYTKLPESLPDRVSALADKITENYESDYDKVSAIEAYLAQNYTYTLTPGDYSRRKDFVDTFLFEKREGYCTYFATAMAVLTRCIGLPSRYVEGYVTPEAYEPGTSTYKITSKQAHAWVEVYFEGFGWLLFEPTATYQSVLQQNNIGNQENLYGMQEVMTTQIEDVVKGGSNEVSSNGYEKLQLIGMRIGLLIGGIILSIVGYRKYRLKHMAPRTYIIYRYKAHCEKLKKKGFKFEQGETELMFARRVDATLKLETVTFEEITKLYLAARYSNHDIAEWQKKKMHEFHASLKKSK
ncbi:MAG: transglutaminase domain-containing protein [Niameybacter sp.]|uniref:DUF4129 domain-containing transglutaminase family protein n=1 Tax=Niameybacter sp. TaxID=2033640 RepID=UPI002FC87E6B